MMDRWLVGTQEPGTRSRIDGEAKAIG